MLVRVSNIETFRRWRADPDATPEDLVSRLSDFQPTERMEAGTAFHKALERAVPGEYPELSAMGYTFLFDEDAAIALPSVRELRCYGEYGPIRVTGQVDGLHGKRVEDHKTTGQFNSDGYWEGCQWRFYLDLFGADVFRWNVFEIWPHKTRPQTYHVGEPQFLEQCRYPGLHNDCMELASAFYDFAAKHMPQQLEAA
jgi:hypothetical protein